jgi:hypothetical protein
MTSHVSLVEVMGSESADSGPSSFLKDLNHRLTQKRGTITDGAWLKNVPAESHLATIRLRCVKRFS